VVPGAGRGHRQRRGAELELTELRYPARALLVIGGPPGAGKTTLAERAVRGAALFDPDAVRAELGGDWPAALAATRERFRARLAAGEGAVLVATALRHGHRLGYARDATRAGVPCHLLFVDASADECRAARAAQGDARISDGLFEHLLREWAALRRALAAGEPLPEELASVTLLARPEAAAVERIVLGPGRGG
jgi:predicted kinase